MKTNLWKYALTSFVLAFIAITPAYSFAQKPADDESENPAADTAVVNSPEVDQLGTAKSWNLKSDSQTLEAIDIWLKESSSVPADAFEKATKAFNDSSFSQDRLDRVINAIANVRPDVAEIASQLAGQRESVLPPNFSHLLDNENEHSFVRDHVRLLLGRWLAQNQFYDEALEQLDLLNVDTLLTPESALFYQALVEHQLVQKANFKATVATLLQHQDDLPIRFAVISKMMQSDLASLEDGSLDEISRMMKDNHRQIDLLRSGTLVLNKEAQVISKLDKLIEELEEKQNPPPGEGGGSPGPGGATPSSKGMDDSAAAEGAGSGDVLIRDLADGGQWGDLEPAERSAAMAEMVKDMPPHFRSAIEKYFRRLAAEESGQKGQQ